VTPRTFLVLTFLIAQKSLIEPWIDCIESQHPSMPVMVFENDPVRDDLSRRCRRNAVIGLTDRRFLDYLASTRPKLHSFY
jgi:hypothetical protein